ncbi:MAG: hypothetical protein ABL921_14635 [Pirellula sp.]
MLTASAPSAMKYVAIRSVPLWTESKWTDLYENIGFPGFHFPTPDLPTCSICWDLSTAIEKATQLPEPSLNLKVSPGIQSRPDLVQFSVF